MILSRSSKERARACIAPGSLSRRLLAKLIVDELLGLGLSKLGATPAPERLDFLCRSPFASVFRNTKTCADRILKIHARRQHRFRQNSEARQVFRGTASSRTTVDSRGIG